MLFADTALARRLELHKATAALEYARAQAKLRPGSSDVMPIAGGNAVFVGATSPISKAGGLGMQEPVTADELDAVEAFFLERGMRPKLELCPLADRTLLDLVGQRGYRIDHFRNMLVRPVTADDFVREVVSSVSVAAATSNERRLWMETVTRGFAGRDEISLEDTYISEPMAYVPAVTCYLARLGDEVIGGGAMAIRSGLAYLSTTSIRPAYRGRGAQTALLQTRLLHAAEAGCDLMMVETGPGSPSQRNLERMGFRVVYTTMAVVKA